VKRGGRERERGGREGGRETHTEDILSEIKRLGQFIGKAVPAGHFVFSGQGIGGSVPPRQKRPNKNK
jgi:hypothetical protein